MIELIQKLKENPNDVETRNMLINKYIKLAYFLARKTSEQILNLREDLESEALLALCTAVNNIHNITHDNYMSYISRYIRGALYLYINQQTRVLKIPRDALIKMNTETLKKFENSGDPSQMNLAIKKQTINVFDIFEMVQKSTISDIEHKIILFYLMDYTDSEIAIEIKMSISNVQRIRTTILKRIRGNFENQIK